MRPTADLVSYLNSYFASEIWKSAGDLFKEKIISETDTALRDIPSCSGLTNTRAFFSRAPDFTPLREGGVKLRLPREPGILRLETEILLTDPIPDPDLTVDFSLEMNINEDVPVPLPHVDANVNWGSDFLSFLAGGVVPLIVKRTIEEIIELIIPGILSGELEAELGGLKSYRFSRRFDLQRPDPAQPLIKDSTDVTFNGSSNPKDAGYCDILVVADGFRGTDLNDFDDFVDQIRIHFTSSSSSLERPFSNFQTAIRVWQMPLIADPTDSLQRAAIVASTSDRNTLNFANLARVAEIGLDARDFFGRDPIIVIASRILDEDLERIGIKPGSPGSNVRANGQGPFVLLDLPPHGHSVTSTVRTFVHELGHTSLGRYLADEYTKRDKTYRGPEPRARNISKNPVIGLSKWQPWSGALTNFQCYEGGYEYEYGIYRLQEYCRMKTSSSGDFCQVCTEELARGLLEWCHTWKRRVPGGFGMIDLHVEYLYPWVDSIPRLLHVEMGVTKHLEVLVPPGVYNLPTTVKLKVVGSSVPQMWDISWRVNQQSTPSLDYTGDNVRLALSPGATVDLCINHNNGTGIFDPASYIPETRTQLVFDIEKRITPNDLMPPTDLKQSVGLGAVIDTVVDQATGSLSLSEDLTLSAKLGEVRGFNLDTGVEFRIEKVGGGFERSYNSPLIGDAGEEREWKVDRMIPSGQHVWTARTTCFGLLGLWMQAPRSRDDSCFEVAPYIFSEEPKPPADPFNLELLETLTFPPEPVGLKASSWHPNDRPIKFKFETLKHGQGQQWTATNPPYTNWISRDPANYNTLAVTEMVALDLLPQPGNTGDSYRWRVRAEDDQGRHSAWVEGRPFDMYLLDRRPTSMRELMEILEKISPHVLDPKGPIPIPRVFFAENRPATDHKTDFTRLRRLEKNKIKGPGSINRVKGDRGGSALHSSLKEKDDE